MGVVVFENSRSGYTKSRQEELLRILDSNKAKYINDREYGLRLVQAAKDYMEGQEPLASYFACGFGSVIMETSEFFKAGLCIRGIQLIFKEGDDRPVPAGGFMGWNEDEFELSDEQYDALPLKDKAALEAKLQLEKWIPSEYASQLQSWYDK